MFYCVDIYTEDDFEKLRRFDINTAMTNHILIAIRDNVDFTKPFNPINLEGFNININGYNHTISNIYVNRYATEMAQDFVGMFEHANNISISDLKIVDSYIYGGVKCGTLAGEITNKLKLNNVYADKLIVNAEAFCGGIVGRCNEAEILNSTINSHVYGHDVVGGVVGMANKYTEENSVINTDGYAVGKAIGNEAGYCELKFIKRK